VEGFLAREQTWLSPDDRMMFLIHSAGGGLICQPSTIIEVKSVCILSTITPSQLQQNSPLRRHLAGLFR
jgi:hypothetical protein